MSNTVVQTGAVATLGAATQATTAAAPVCYFGFLGNVTPGAPVVISNMPGSNGPNTANTTPTHEVTQLVSAMASYSTASCCCASPAPLASIESPVLLASAH